jgi:hypothetical protein
VAERDVEDTHISNGDMLTDEVVVDLYMLGALMLDGVGGGVDIVAHLRIDIVAVDQSDPRLGVMQLLK